jgi:hypothetical protein
VAFRNLALRIFRMSNGPGRFVASAMLEVLPSSLPTNTLHPGPPDCQID